jgi:hypothetical protein
MFKLRVAEAARVNLHQTQRPILHFHFQSYRDHEYIVIVFRRFWELLAYFGPCSTRVNSFVLYVDAPVRSLASDRTRDVNHG